MRDCPYIPFGTLSATADESTSGITFEAAHVYRRETTAKALGISEQQFVELCIVIGNDYTGQFDQAFLDCMCDFTVDGARRKEALLEGITLLGDSFRAESSYKLLQTAVEFSRDVYELRDLSKYPFDDFRSIEIEISLTSEEKTSILAMMSGKSAAEKAWENYKVLLIEASLSCEYIANSHVYPLAIAHMLDNIDVEKENIPSSAAKRNPLPVWEDFIAAYYYQLVLKVCLKCIPDVSSCSYILSGVHF